MALDQKPGFPKEVENDKIPTHVQETLIDSIAAYTKRGEKEDGIVIPYNPPYGGYEAVQSGSERLTVVRVKRKREDLPVDSLWLENVQKKCHVAPIDRLSLSEDGQSEGWREREAAKNARYEQVSRKRQKSKNLDQSGDSISEIFHLYDIVRVNGTEEEDEKDRQRIERREKAKREAARREGQLLLNFMPLLREHVPLAAKEVVKVVGGEDLKREEEVVKVDEENESEYVYDVYSVDNNFSSDMPDLEDRPVVKVNNSSDLDFGDGTPSDFDEEDSNDENQPYNDYPEEEDSEGVEEIDDGDDDDNFDSKYRMPGLRRGWESDEEKPLYGYNNNDKEEYNTVAYDADEDVDEDEDEDDEDDNSQRTDNSNNIENIWRPRK